MKLPTVTYEFEFLTDCFSGTAEGKEARHSELRVPPIRGHVRMWHNMAFGAESCHAVWGNTSGDGTGSRVAMRFLELPPVSKELSEVLPHKNKQGGKRPALPAGTRATLELTRLPHCTAAQWEIAQKATKLWLLLGTLGLRSARAAGSVWPVADWVPADAKALRDILASLGLKNLEVALIGEAADKTAAELRATASDTVANHRDVFGDSGKNSRLPSPTCFKVIRLGPSLCLLAHAPRGILAQAQTLLQQKPAPKRWLELGEWNFFL